MKKITAIIIVLHKKKLLFSIPVVLGLIAFIFTQQNTKLVIFPGKQGLFTVTTYCDGSEDGATEITEPAINDNKITFEYTLRKKHPYPYAGLHILLMHDSTFLDISRYNYLFLDVSAENTESFTIYFKAFIDDFSSLEKPFTYEFLMKEVSLDSLSSRYRVNFSEFVHPSWWLEQNKIAESNIKKPRFSKVISMQIQNGLFAPFDKPVKLTVRNITIARDNTSGYVILGLLLIFYFVIYLILYLVIQRKNKIISYKELDVKNDADEDIKRIMNTVAKNYADPGFTVEKLAREAGVSSSKIPGMLKERFNLNFKQYLNTIRITEAKRLLRETDNQIVTIAYNVGYNNIPHFNRTFKQFEGMSPKEYRKGQQDGKDNK